MQQEFTGSLHLKEQRFTVSDWSMYLRFLYTQAANDDKCLSELQKHAGAHPRSADILCISGSFLANVNDAEVVRSLKLDRLIKENGAITGVSVRSPKPDRLAAIFVVTQTLTQAGVAALLALLVIPDFGWQGGFLTLGAIALVTSEAFGSLALSIAQFGKP